MLEAIIWDKLSPINGVSAETIIESQPYFGGQATVFLVYNSTVPSRIMRIESLDIIRSNNGYGEDMSDEDVIDAYLEQANAPSPSPAVATDNELAIMEALAEIYEQNL